MYKYFIFSDVHGEYDVLIKELKKAGYDQKNPSHKLISLGDNFDRGPKSFEIYRFLRNQNAYVVAGNHEKLFYEYLVGVSDGRFDTEHNGLRETLEAFSGRTLSKDEYDYLFGLRYWIMDRHPLLDNWLGTLPDGFKLDDHILIHAGFQNKTLISPEDDERWYPHHYAKTPQFIEDYKNEDGYIYVFGHWHAFRLYKQFWGREEELYHPFVYKNFIGLDAATNLTYRVNIYTINSENEPIPFSQSQNLETIKKL